jgi:CRP-like cAMP-binding protein
MSMKIAGLPLPLSKGVNNIPSPTLSHVGPTVVSRLGLSSRALRSGQEIVGDGKRCNTIYLITEGVAIRYRVLQDGRRQILNFLLPGDFAGVTSCRYEHALYSIRTLTRVLLSPIPVTKLSTLIESDPRLAAELFWSFVSETALLAEHLIAVGRRTATERIAHLLLELHMRLQLVGLADASSYQLPLTQEMIGDALGLSVPYVNRVLRQLRQDKLVSIQDRFVVIENQSEWADLADFRNTYLRPRSLAELGENA